MQQNSITIYDHDYNLRNAFKLITKELSENNLELIKKYDKEMVNCSLTKATRHKHLKMILSLSRLLQKDWINVTKEDIETLVYDVMEKYGNELGQETNTTWDHKKILKIFVRWIKLGSRDKDEVGDPPETKHVKIRKVQGKVVREDLLTEEDRTKLLHACGENTRDRALIDCHFEAGTRPGEILNLQIRHVKFDKHGAVIHVDGKTGPRPIRLVKATPHLAAWMEAHPLKDNPNAPLWPNLSYHNYGHALTYAGARIMLKKRCRMANLSKRVYMNLFRHSEATVTANFMTEAQMRKRHGWSADSRMPARYVHLVNSDVEKAIFEHYGIQQEEEQETQKMPIKCHFCQIPNSSDSTNCVKCGKPLDLKTAIESDKPFYEALEELQEQKKLVKQLVEMQKDNQERIVYLNNFVRELEYKYVRKPFLERTSKTP